MTNLETFLTTEPYSTNTIDRYRRALTKLLERHPDPSNLSPAQLRAWLTDLGHGPNATWVAYCAARSYLAWAYGRQHPALALRVRREDTPPQRTLDIDQVQALLASHDTMTPKGIRDLALCSLLLDTGLRASEVCRLRLDHLNRANHGLVVQIKGGKYAEGHYSPHTASYLDHWLGVRSSAAAPGVKTLFVGLGGTKPGTPLTRDGLGAIVRAWGQRIGIKLSPHDLRRTFATLALRAGAPTRVVQIAGRWKDSKMVERYSSALKADDIDRYLPVTKAME